MKKCLSVFLSLLMVMGTISAFIGGTSVLSFADGETSGTCGENLTWSYDESTGTLTISGDGEMEGYIDSFESPWYDYNESIKHVVFNGTITNIGDRAFLGCTGLMSITLPNSVIDIGNCAFGYCKGLTSITIPDSVTTIGTSVFEYCSGLESMTVDENNPTYHSAGNCFINTESKTLISGCKNSVIPDDGSVTSIGKSAFEGCYELTSITIPNSVTNIGDRAFLGCTGLTSIDIPEGVTIIGDYAFGGCEGLTDITIPDSVTSIGDGAFDHCYELTSITIPDGVTNIGDYAFYYCPGLMSITLPNSVIDIGNCAFGYCKGLTSITIPDSVTTIGTNVFEYCSGLESMTVDENNPTYHSAGNCIIETESKKLIAGCKNSIIPDDGSVTSIGKSAFEGCYELTSITIPNSVTNIGDMAFGFCSGLTKITIGNSVTSIGTNAFFDCSGLTSITIPDSVTSIGGSAFQYCSGLTSITISSSLTSIGERIFAYCDSLTSITVSEGNHVYHSAGNCVIETATKMLVAGCKNSVIPDDGSVKSIGRSAFQYCTSLKSIIIPDSVTSIGNMAFYDCTGLERATIGNNVTNIGEDAFGHCESLTSITIPNSVTSIGDDAFERCAGLKDVYYAGSEADRYNIAIGDYNDNLLNATWHYNSTGPADEPDNPDNPDNKEPIYESPDGVVLYDDYSARMPDGRIIENAIDISVAENGVEFNLTQLTPQQNEGFNDVNYGCACNFDLSLADPDGADISEQNPATIRIKKEFIGFNITSIVIFHYPQSGGRESFTAAKNDPRFRITDDGEYWKITVTSLSPFGIYYMPVLNVKASQTVDYKANVTVTATAENVPEGYALAIYEGNSLKAKGNAESVSYKAGTMTANRTFTVKIIDSGNNALKDVEENEIKANCEVKVKTGFFDKLIAFFKGLFGLLPNVEIKP